MKDEPQPEHHESHHTHRVGSLRGHLVRETLSDLENQLTADHHLDGDEPETARPAAAEDTGHSEHTDNR